MKTPAITGKTGDFVHDFSCALLLMKEGYKVARTDWINAGITHHLSLQFPDKNSKMTRPYLYATDETGAKIPYVISNGDLFSSWKLIREDETP